MSWSLENIHECYRVDTVWCTSLKVCDISLCPPFPPAPAPASYGITLQPAADNTHRSTSLVLPVRQEVLVPQPAYSQQYNIYSSNAHAEDHGRSAFTGSSCFIEVGIHDAHGHQVEEEVAPIQGTVLGR